MKLPPHGMSRVRKHSHINIGAVKGRTGLPLFISQLHADTTRMTPSEEGMGDETHGTLGNNEHTVSTDNPHAAALTTRCRKKRNVKLHRRPTLLHLNKIVYIPQGNPQH